MAKKIMAIINPVAGGGKTAKIWPKKSEYFKKAFDVFDEQYTKAAGDAVEIASRAVKENYDYIMAVGGDGTVNEIINGMLLSSDYKNIKLIIYPLGTGSDFSRVLNLGTDAEKILRLINNNKSRKIRLVEAEFYNYQQQLNKRYFINIADCGMGAEVVKKLNESERTIDGSLSYLIKIFQTLFAYQNKEMKVIADNRLIYQGRLNTVIVAHGSYFGGGIKIAPEANLKSNKLNLILLKDFSKIAIVLNLIKAYRGKHLNHPLVESLQVEQLKIISSEKAELELDGESVGVCNASFKLSDKKISIIS